MTTKLVEENLTPLTSVGQAVQPATTLVNQPAASQLQATHIALSNTAALLKTVSKTSLLQPISKISATLIPIHWPPILLNSISYTLPLGSAFHCAQGQNFAVSVRFKLNGPATTIHFTYSGLPAGVTPVTTSVAFAANADRRIFLNFNVPHSTPIQSAKPLVVHYSGYAGLVTQKGDIPLTLVVNTGFDMQQQLESNWCWAGTSTSIAHFYNPASTVTQCQVVNNQLGRSDCCANGASSACNQPGYLDKALSFVGHLDHWVGATEPYATVVNEVTAWRPLGIRVAWSGGGAHFIAATGYEQGNLLIIQDPIYQTSIVNYSTMFGTYQGSGNWTHSYFTKP